MADCDWTCMYLLEPKQKFAWVGSSEYLSTHLLVRTLERTIVPVECCNGQVRYINQKGGTGKWAAGIDIVGICFYI